MESVECSNPVRRGTLVSTLPRLYRNNISIKGAGWRNIALKPTRMLRAQNNLYIFSLLTSWKRACLNENRNVKG